MKKVLHKAETRGHANHGWLDTYHTFSFASYYNPDRMNFGALRVLNDDTVEGGMGFGTHPHDNMEIVSIPLSGDLQHRDSMGNIAVIKEGDIQIMSAGTGVSHSEFNKNKDKRVNFLQIWVFPKVRNIAPRYDQITLSRTQGLQQVVSPDKAGPGVWINQDAWFHLGRLSPGNPVEYKCKGNGTGAYVFVQEGILQIDGQTLSRRDGLGIWDAGQFQLTPVVPAEVLLIEVALTVS